MKKFLAGIAFFFILTFASAENKTLSFEFSPEFGVLMGTVNEYVFDEHCKNTNNMLSRLDWDLQCTPYFSGKIDFTIANLIYIGTKGKIAIPGRSGYIQDYDWKNSTTDAWIHDDPHELTNYSKNTNFLDHYYNLSFAAGGKISIKDTLYIIPLISYEYSYIKFHATDGFYAYKNDDFKIHNITGDSFTYEQESNILKTGLQIDFEPIPKIFISTDFYISPGLAHINALDCHIDRSLAFFDEMNNGILLQTGSSVFYNINNNNKLGFTLNFEYLPVSKGQTSFKSLDSNNKPNKYIAWNRLPNDVKGGTSHFIFNCGINYSLHF